METTTTVRIERISNGFLVTDSDSMKGKSFYPTLVDFVNARVLEDIKDKDEYFITHDAEGEEFSFDLSVCDL